MPVGDRGNVRTIVMWSFVGLLIILCAIMIWDVSARNANYDQRADYYSANHASETKSAIERECVSTDVSAIRKCIEEKVRAEQESQRSEHDLSAQQAMADWAFGVLVVSFVTLLATVAGVVYVRNTLLETRRIGERQVRAYIGVVEASIRGTNTASPTIRVKIKNAGQSPAYKVAIRTGYVVNFTGPPRYRDTSTEKIERGFDIGPGQEVHHPIYVHELIWTVAKASVINKGGRFFVFGWIYYEDAFEAAREALFRFEFYETEDGIKDGEHFTITAAGNRST